MGWRSRRGCAISAIQVLVRSSAAMNSANAWPRTLSAMLGAGCPSLMAVGAFSDVEIARAVAYMANQGGGQFTEPPAPAPAQ